MSNILFNGSKTISSKQEGLYFSTHGVEFFKTSLLFAPVLFEYCEDDTALVFVFVFVVVSTGKIRIFELIIKFSNALSPSSSP